ncbi:hypothetical protein [Endozoicomonas atrinae]|uniref:hypothetical protein n=1 Tax=Endozoicomonas atrinae TaxID=1333660 RepID=UPI0008247BD1|nr:hypothetical protein [Endozoicomonas atrinae]
MESASGAGSANLQQLQTIQDLADKGMKCEVKFGVNGEITSIEVMKDVQPTPGLKLSDQQPDVSVPRKIPLKQRKAEIAAEKDTVTVREAIFNKLKSVKNYFQTKFESKFPKAAERNRNFEASVSKAFSDFKKAVKHENWEKIPEDSVKAGSDQLKTEVEVHNESIDQLESLESQKAERKTELDTLNKVYKNTRKVCEDPEGVIQSKARITVPIPIEGVDPVVIESSDPLVRREQVNEVMAQFKESGFVDRIRQLDSEIQHAKSEQKQLKESMKESGNRILELFMEEQNTLSQAEDRNTKLSQFQGTLTEQRLELDSEVEQLQSEIRALKNEKQQAEQYVSEQKNLLPALNKKLKSLSKLGLDDPGIKKVHDEKMGELQDAQEVIDIGNARLKSIPGEMKEKKAQLETKMKAIEDLQKGKELNKQEKTYSKEVDAERARLESQLGKRLRKK